MIFNYIYIPVRDVKDESFEAPFYFQFIFYFLIVLIIYLYKKND